MGFDGGNRLRVCDSVIKEMGVSGVPFHEMSLVNIGSTFNKSDRLGFERV